MKIRLLDKKEPEVQNNLSLDVQVFVANPLGLHARPAVRLTKLAKGFNADILLSKDNGAHWVDAKSIVRVMGMKVKVGGTLRVKASGPDARQAVGKLMELFEEIFAGNGRADS